jgi:hypothetical protein
MKNFLEYMKSGSTSDYKEGGSFKKHKMFIPPNFDDYVIAETEDDHNYYQSQGYLHEDELPTANMGMNISDAFNQDATTQLKGLTKEINGSKFEGPSAPQNMNTDMFGKAKIDFFVNTLSTMTDRALEEKAIAAANEELQNPMPVQAVPMMNYGGNFYTNYDELGTFGFNPGMNNQAAWYNKANQYSGADFLGQAGDFITDVAIDAGENMQRSKLKKREWYTGSDVGKSNLEVGRDYKDFDPKKYRLFGQASEYSIKDMFDKDTREERRAGLEMARDVQKAGRQQQRAAEQTARQNMREGSSLIKSWFNDEALKEREALKGALENQKEQAKNWRKSYTVQATPIDMNQSTDVSTEGLSDDVLAYLEEQKARREYERSFMKKGGEMKNQFGGKVNKGKYMYHMGGNLPPHLHSGAAQDMSDMISASGDPIFLQGYNINDPNSFTSAISNPTWRAGANRAQSVPFTVDPSLQGAYGKHWMNYDPRYGYDSPILGSGYDDPNNMPMIPGVTGYYNTMPNALYPGHPGSFSYYNAPASGFENYYSNRGTSWSPGAARTPAPAPAPTPGGGGAGGGSRSGSGSGSSTSTNTNTNAQDWKTWNQNRKGNVTTDDNVTTQVDEYINNMGTRFGLPPGYYDVNAGPFGGGASAFVWGSDVRPEIFDKTPNRLFRRGKTRIVLGPSGQPTVVADSQPGDTPVSETPETTAEEINRLSGVPDSSKRNLSMGDLYRMHQVSLEQEMAGEGYNPKIDDEVLELYNQQPFMNRGRNWQQGDKDYEFNKGVNLATNPRTGETMYVPEKKAERWAKRRARKEEREMGLGGITTGEYTFGSGPFSSDTFFGKDGNLAGAVGIGTMMGNLRDQARYQDYMDTNFGFSDATAMVTPTNRGQAVGQLGGEYSFGGLLDLWFLFNMVTPHGCL